MRLEQRCTWNMYDMRNYCIRHDYYTNGDNKAYSTMLNFVEDNEPTAKNVELVAIDIITHSDKIYSIFRDGDIDYITCEIWNEVINVRFEAK